MKDKSELPNAQEQIRKFAASLCLLTALAAAAAFSYVKIWNPDFWFHLKVGELIYSNAADSSVSSKLPSENLFYTPGSSETPRYDQWMGNLYLYAAYEKSGVSGVQKLAVAISLFICFALFFTARNGGADPILAAPLIVASILAARPKLAGHTPDMFFYLFLVLVFYLLNQLLKNEETGAKSTKSIKRAFQAAFIIPVAQIIWVNFHPTAAISIFLVFAALFSSIFAFVLNEKRSTSLQPSISSLSLKMLGVTLLITIAATILNPHWFHGYSIPFISSVEYLTISSPLGIAYVVCVALGIAGFYLSRNNLNLFHLTVFTVSAFFAYIARDSAPVFFLLSAPIISISISVGFKRLFKTGGAYFASSLVSIIVIALSAYFIVSKNDSLVWGEGIDDAVYPESAIDFINSNEFQGAMYNSSIFSGPLSWGVYPKHKPFRCVEHSKVCHGFNSFENNPLTAQWLKLSDGHNIQFAIIKAARSDFALKLAESNVDWNIVFWDSSAIVMAKDIPAHNKLISSYSYKTALTPGAAVELSKSWKNLRPETRMLFLIELERAFNSSKRNFAASTALANVMKHENNWDKVIAFSDIALSQNNNDAALHALKGEAYLAKGNADEALSSFKSASEIDSSYERLLNSIGAGNTGNE